MTEYGNLRDRILAVSDIVTEDVIVPEWGETLRVRSISGEERDAFEKSLFTGRGKDRVENMGNLRARLVALSVVDDDGNAVFTPDDAAALGKKNAAALDRVFTVAMRLSGLNDEDVEELAKNSESSPNGDSSLN